MKAHMEKELKFGWEQSHMAALKMPYDPPNSNGSNYYASFWRR
jgi:hypothetical protein